MNLTRHKGGEVTGFGKPSFKQNALALIKNNENLKVIEEKKKKVSKNKVKEQKLNSTSKLSELVPPGGDSASPLLQQSLHEDTPLDIESSQCDGNLFQNTYLQKPDRRMVQEYSMDIYKYLRRIEVGTFLTSVSTRRRVVSWVQHLLSLPN